MRTLRQQIAVILLSAVMLVFGAALQAAAQSVSGKLLDQYTNQPIANATVTLVTPDNAPVGPKAKTGKDGSFSIRAPAPGVYRLRANLAGYLSAVTPAIELAAGDQINLTWHLLAGVVQMRPVAIVSNDRPTSRRLSSFYERAQRHAFGYFVTRDKIDQMRPFYVTDLLRTIPGLIVAPSMRSFGNIVRTTEGCRPAVYLDGLRFPLMGESIDDIVNPNELEGVEVYSHAAEVPAEFQGPFSNCGVIALWTKRA
jgi:hypothetical protein